MNKKGFTFRFDVLDMGGTNYHNCSAIDVRGDECDDDLEVATLQFWHKVADYLSSSGLSPREVRIACRTGYGYEA